ncbi:uncharacterized protein PgNI_07549 [Pyricularia grisea]|uniref:Uncharacterized protein n=1 Tax=Pyricularia grisea TaxID=148305 RepID=A0A6P8B2R8_PYRGI|nr:uncharacterized protein PgNI_07549 [Pyricularia grisea]TLD09205.1 hypothetical protein PgNI_07549 [Pyricularia grisea]
MGWFGVPRGTVESLKAEGGTNGPRPLPLQVIDSTFKKAHADFGLTLPMNLSHDRRNPLQQLFWAEMKGV